MKKIITLIAIVLVSITATAQQRFEDGIYSNYSKNINRLTDVMDCIQVSYGHSFVASHDFNNVSEIWLRVSRFECSFYWDPKDYNEYIDYNYRDNYGKSYINYKRDVTQGGYSGMKLGWAFNKYFSAGLNFSFGAMAVYCETEDYHYHSLNTTDHYWTLGLELSEPYQNFGVGLYGKAQFNIGRFVLFTSAQINTNTEMILSAGVGILLNKGYWF